MYDSNHNQCSSHKKGSYQTELSNFVKAYSKQLAQESDKFGTGYRPNESTLQYLHCMPYYYNGAYVSKFECMNVSL